MVSRKKGRRPASGAANDSDRDAPERSGIAPGHAATASTGDRHWGAESARPGWPDAVPQKIAWMDRQIERQQFSRAEVVALWHKAIGKSTDAAVHGLTADTVLELAYTAGRLACSAVLAAHHIRIKSTQGHYEMTFQAVAALDLPGCEDIAVDSEEVRGFRHNADYTATLAAPEDVQHALAWMRSTVPVLRAALVAGDPELEPFLAALA